MNCKYVFIIVLSLATWGLDAPKSWAQSEVLTRSSNSSNQFHRNMLGDCSATRIDCGPDTFNAAPTAPGPDFAFMEVIDADSPGTVLSDSVTCVDGAFGSAAGNAPGQTPGNGDQCLTTGGIHFPGVGGNNQQCDIPSVEGIAPQCLAQFNDRYSFTGLPRIPTGADTQFGTGAPGALPLSLSGTVSAGVNQRTVTGAGTLFLSELQPGDILILGGHVKRVRSITSDTTLEIDTNFEAAVPALTAISKSDRTFTNVMDIGGAGNDNRVPTGSSDATIAFTVHRSIQDALGQGCTESTIGAGFPGPTACNSGFDLTDSAPAPGNIPAGTCIAGPCPANFVGNRFRSAVATGDAVCEAVAPGTFCRKNEIEYGFTMRFENGIVGVSNDCAEGSDLNLTFGNCFVGAGSAPQEAVISFRVISFTDNNGDLLASPTGFYFHELNETDGPTTLSSETGAFRTTVTFPGGVPSIGLELDQSLPFDFVTNDGCPHDSNGLSCSPRIAPGDTLLP